MLGRLGIEATWCDPRCELGPGIGTSTVRPRIGGGANGKPPHSATIWSGLQQRIETLHERVRNLAWRSRFLPWRPPALPLLTPHSAPPTLDQMGAVRQRNRLGLATLVVIVFWVDSEGWPWLIGGLIGTPLVGLALWYIFVAAERKGWCHPRADSGSFTPKRSDQSLLLYRRRYLPGAPSEPWARAAYHYAIGMMYFKVYGDAERASHYLTCAVALRPTSPMRRGGSHMSKA